MTGGGLRNIVQDWWGDEVNSGPKRKRKLMENQEISVQYTRLAIVLPEWNDDDDAANNDVDESELGERANVLVSIIKISVHESIIYIH